MNLQISDFDRIVTAEGYQIKYKGQIIGGASILGKSKARGKARYNDIKSYCEIADREIESLVNGYGRPDMFAAINHINQKPQIK